MIGIPGKLLAIHISLLVFITAPTNCFSSEPFVAGFDRFGLHGDIDSVAAGNLLISELSCTACHASEAKPLEPKRGPRLHDAGTRLSPDWMRQYLASPDESKPGTTMPDLLAGMSSQERDEIANELTAFLMSQSIPLPPVKASGVNPVPMEFWNKGDAANGKALYHRVGCVACHDPDASVHVSESSDSQLDRLLDELDPEELSEMGLASAARKVRSIPQADLAAKYTRHALTHFILDPLRSRPSGRMPNLKLLAVEAADIAAYLQQDASHLDGSIEKNTELLIERGRVSFSTLRCAQCHDVPGVDSTATAKRFDLLRDGSDDGCLNQQVANYALSKAQTDAIRDAMAAAKRNDKQKPSQQLVHSMLQLNCFACHSRDELGGVGRFRKNYFHTVDEIDLGDEGRLPPPLTHVGLKITKSRFEKVLLGRKADVRPHMHIRMPIFPTSLAKSLPTLFAKIDGARTASEQAVFGEGKQTEEVGRQLMDVGCVECHAFRGNTLPGVVGVDLEGINARVRPSWFRDFLLNPISLKARTRMPTFFPDGKSQHPQLLGGDPNRQIGAMWAYLKDLPQQPLPEKIEQARSQNYELVPKNEPIILRTFMQDVGTHAIAVGFPEGVHYAFDVNNGNLAVGWRGRFLDAQGTWYIRFTPPATALGKEIMPLPRQSLFDVSASDTSYRFKGYRLNSQRVPTFLYTIGGHAVEDQITPDDKNGLRRNITIKKSANIESPDTLLLYLNRGESLTRKSPSSFTNDHGLTVSLKNPSDWATVDDDVSGNVWTVPVSVKADLNIEVNYSW